MGADGLCARVVGEGDVCGAQLLDQADSAWRDFGQLHGTRLRFGKAARGLTELRTADQLTLASVRGSWSTTFSAGGSSFTLQRTSASSSPAVGELLARAARAEAGHYAKNTRLPLLTDIRLDSSVRGLADEMGTPILYTAGRNYDWRAGASIVFPDQRWLRFLVRGSVLANAIMTAVDQAGNRVARYRCKSGRVRSPGSVEIIVHPGQKLADELVLALALSAGWLVPYFERPGG